MSETAGFWPPEWQSLQPAGPKNDEPMPDEKANAAGVDATRATAPQQAASMSREYVGAMRQQYSPLRA